MIAVRDFERLSTLDISCQDNSYINSLPESERPRGLYVHWSLTPICRVTAQSDCTHNENDQCRTTKHLEDCRIHCGIQSSAYRRDVVLNWMVEFLAHGSISGIGETNLGFKLFTISPDR